VARHVCIVYDINQLPLASPSVRPVALPVLNLPQFPSGIYPRNWCRRVQVRFEVHYNDSHEGTSKSRYAEILVLRVFWLK
jgi:hypothetical protein